MRMKAPVIAGLLLVVTSVVACSPLRRPSSTRPASPTPSSLPQEQATAKHTETPPSPKPTSSPTTEPAPTIPPTPTAIESSRILVEPGQASTVLEGHLDAGQADRYVLRGREGYTLDVEVEPPSDVGLAIWGADGIPLKRRIDEETSWRDELPATQDTFIEVSAIEATAYTLTVSITAPGSKASISVIEPDGGEEWLEGSSHTIAWRSTGVQTIDVAVASGGKPLGQLALGLETSAGQLTWHIPVGLVSNFGVAMSDSMRVRVSDSNDPDLFDENDEPFTIQSPRIQFAAGAISATVTGTLPAEGGSYRYVLMASQDQRLEMELTPAEVDVEVWGAEEGSTWHIPSGQRRLVVAGLPATQDYFVTLTNPSASKAVDYKLDVVIP